MSERKSWDIQPKRRTVQIPVPPTPQPAARAQVRKSAPAPRPEKPRKIKQEKPKKPIKARRQQVIEVSTKPNTRIDRGASLRDRSVQGKEREPLKERRRRERRRSSLMLGIFFMLLVLGCGGFFWLPFVRIQHIEAAGPDTSGMQSITTSSLQGTYEYIFPRNSIFFFPEDVIRQQILSHYPDISAVSISRSSFDTIGIISIPREAALTWCGSTYTPGVSGTATTVIDASTTESSASSTTDSLATNSIGDASMPVCYSADADGVIFAPITGQVTPSTETLTLYGPLSAPLNTDQSIATSSPLGSVIAESDMIPNALQFVKAMRSLGAPVVTLVLRGDEADLYTQEGTRITYVLGEEHDAAQLAESAFPSLNVSDGSLEYIDLRFQGKVYFKKTGEDSQSSSTPQSQ